MKHLLFTILAVLFTMTAMAQNDGSTCEKAIYVDSLMMQSIEANTTYWFTANTDDLPLTVYFFPDEEPEVAPEIYIDFTCEPGVYEDQNIRDIVDLAIDMGIYFPFGMPFDTIEVDGATAYRVSYERDLLELLVMLGIDYSVPVYVQFRSPVAGSAQVSNIKTVTDCSALHQRVETQDTLYLQANTEALYYFPVSEWKGRNISFTWTGNPGVRAYVETDCEFDTITSRYTYKFEQQNTSGMLVQEATKLDIDNYISASEDGNLYALFIAPEDGTIYVGDYADHGSVTLDNCIGNRKTNAIEFPAADMALTASVPSKSYRIESIKLQDKNIRLKWKTTENKPAVAYFANFCGFELKAADPDVVDTIHFAFNEEEQAMIADIPRERVNNIVKQNTDGWLFMQIFRQEAGTFWWDTYEVVEPDCDSKSILLQPNDSAYMPANYYNTSYKMPVDAWKEHAHTFTWRGNRKAYIFIADTCSFPLAPYNVHVGKYMELSPNASVELSQSDMDFLVNNYAADNNLYLRLRSDAEGYLVTHQIEKIVIDTIETTVSACESYEWKGTTYTESGTYEHHSQDTQGKQTHEILHLTINHSVTVEIDQTACDSLIWHDKKYTESGTYTYLTQTLQGCDSTEILHLTINYSDTTKYSAEVCDYFVWKDVTYTTSGIYTHRTQTAQGCDHVELLQLTINYGDTVELAPVTATDSYTWHDIEYTESGTYTYLTKTDQGCDSLEILQLTINSSAGFENTIVAEGENAKLVMINQSLYIQVQGTKSTEYYDLTGRKVEQMD